MNTPRTVDSVLKEFEERGLGCCSGDFCGQGRPHEYDHTDAIKEFLRSALTDIATSAREEERKYIREQLMFAQMDERVFTDDDAKKYTGYDCSVWIWKGDVEKLLSAPPQ